MSKSLGIYALGIIETKEPVTVTFGKVNFDQKESKVFTIHYEDIAMVAARVPIKVYTPKKRNVLSHQYVLTKVMETYSVIPFSFGNTFKSVADVKKLLKSLYTELKTILEKIQGKIEVGLKVVGKKAWLEEEVRDYGNIEHILREIDNKSENAAFYDRIKLGEEANAFFESLQQTIVTEIFTPLSDLAFQSKQNELMNERILLNAAFLIDRSTEKGFDHKVNDLYEKWEGKLDFNYSGPWPAYNFINIRLKIEG